MRLTPALRTVGEGRAWCAVGGGFYIARAGHSTLARHVNDATTGTVRVRGLTRLQQAPRIRPQAVTLTAAGCEALERRRQRQAA